MIKCSKTHNVILFLNDLIAELIDKEFLKERNEKLVFSRYITHNSCAISVVPPFNRL